MSDEIQIARYSEARRKLLSIKGSDNLSVDSHVQPGLTFDDWTLKENRFVQRVNTWATFRTTVAVVGQFTGFEIVPQYVPGGVTGDRVVVVEGFSILSVAGNLNIRAGLCSSNVFPTLTTLQSSDSRGQFSAGALFRNGAIAAIAFTPQQLGFNLAVGEYKLFDRTTCSAFPFVLGNRANTANAAFTVVSLVANTALELAIWGYDRDATESEF